MSGAVSGRQKGEHVAPQYEAYARTPHGRLRHDLLYEHYRRFLDQHPVRWVFDVGGGSGLLVRRLAETLPGLRYVLIDDDEGMLAEAESNLAELRRDAPCELVRASYDTTRTAIEARVRPGDRCLVAFNHVIEYIADKRGALRELASAVRPGDYLGMMYLNNSHEALRRFWHKGSMPQLLRQLDNTEFDAGTFGMGQAIRTRDVDAIFAECGLHQLEDRGLRCVAEFQSKELVADRYEEVLAGELAVSGEPDFIGLARYRLKFFSRDGAR
jgi:SAM-dependent methyltransferase